MLNIGDCGVMCHDEVSGVGGREGIKRCGAVVVLGQVPLVGGWGRVSECVAILPSDGETQCNLSK